MITAIGGFLFDTTWGKAVAIAAGVLAMFSAWLWRHDAHVRTVAILEFGASVNKEAEKLSDKARKARKPADAPGAADRLRKSSCRDC